MTIDSSSIDVSSSRRGRAQIHAALGEEHRLAIVDALRVSDRTPSELQELAELGSNLLAFHLNVLEDAGLIERRRSRGDGRRRYVRLRWEALRAVRTPLAVPEGLTLFVCTRNAARSQLAEALWRARTGGEATSAGTRPAAEIDPLARAVAADHGLELAGCAPRGYGEVDSDPDLVVSVCDRARESGLPWAVPHLHWSVRDPTEGDRASYERAYGEIERRIDRLGQAVPGGSGSGGSGPGGSA